MGAKRGTRSNTREAAAAAKVKGNLGTTTKARLLLTKLPDKPSARVPAKSLTKAAPAVKQVAAASSGYKTKTQDVTPVKAKPKPAARALAKPEKYGEMKSGESSEQTDFEFQTTPTLVPPKKQNASFPPKQGLAKPDISDMDEEDIVELSCTSDDEDDDASGDDAEVEQPEAEVPIVVFPTGRRRSSERRSSPGNASGNFNHGTGMELQAWPHQHQTSMPPQMFPPMNMQQFMMYGPWGIPMQMHPAMAMYGMMMSYGGQMGMGMPPPMPFMPQSTVIVHQQGMLMNPAAAGGGGGCYGSAYANMAPTPQRQGQEHRQTRR